MALRLGIGLGIIPQAARPVPTLAPVNTVLPSITGIRTQGQTVSADPGEWTGLPSGAFTYEWQRWNGSSWAAISGATSSTYVAQAADVSAGSNALRVRVTATNDLGSTSANSPPVTIAAPLTISGSPGAATAGLAYSFIPASAGGRAPRSYALTGTLPAGLSFNTSTGAISGTPVSSGTASGLSIVETDFDGLTATLGPFSISVANSGEGEGLINTVEPVITGVPEVGEVLTLASNGTWVEAPVNTIAPTISGTAEVGEVLTLTDQGTFV